MYDMKNVIESDNRIVNAVAISPSFWFSCDIPIGDSSGAADRHHTSSDLV
jgi:hypothetical protein